MLLYDIGSPPGNFRPSKQYHGLEACLFIVFYKIQDSFNIPDIAGKANHIVFAPEQFPVYVIIRMIDGEFPEFHDGSLHRISTHGI
jgi:hypothetical protein